MLTPVLITDESFKGFGKILHSSTNPPVFDNNEFSFTAEVFKFVAKDKMSVGILKAYKRDIKPECLESHADTVEMLFQLENNSVIFLAKSKSLDEIKAFYFSQGEAIAINQGIWHWVPFPYDCDFCKTLVIFNDGTSSNDCEIVHL